MTNSNLMNLILKFAYMDTYMPDISFFTPTSACMNKSVPAVSFLTFMLVCMDTSIYACCITHSGIRLFSSLGLIMSVFASSHHCKLSIPVSAAFLLALSAVVRKALFFDLFPSASTDLLSRDVCPFLQLLSGWALYSHERSVPERMPCSAALTSRLVTVTLAQ